MRNVAVRVSPSYVCSETSAALDRPNVIVRTSPRTPDVSRSSGNTATPDSISPAKMLSFSAATHRASRNTEGGRRERSAPVQLLASRASPTARFRPDGSCRFRAPPPARSSAYAQATAGHPRNCSDYRLLGEQPSAAAKNERTVVLPLLPVIANTGPENRCAGAATQGPQTIQRIGHPQLGQ